jgi:hypothetical protein
MNFCKSSPTKCVDADDDLIRAAVFNLTITRPMTLLVTARSAPPLKAGHIVAGGNMQGQTAVVTGGGNGIGKAADLGLACPGAHVFLMHFALSAAQFAASKIFKGGISARAMQNSFEYSNSNSNSNSRFNHV